MKPWPGVAEFQHVAEHGNALALPLGLGPAQHLEGCPHRAWIGIVTLIDQKQFAARRLEPVAHAASLRWLNALERLGCGCEIRADKLGSAKHSKRVHDDMLSGHADPIGDALAQDRCVYGGRTVLKPAPLEPDVGGLGLAEAE